ncbi:hypothetical protein [Stenomitos frigidus]|uniref:Uncharacterized protein n=1 Tax=Stenomitos frigidus ULC18 TaxID=2107698 RepID=A0A2T1EAU0_9CYAN|nr:hypothetical protein [Stenomitos frigidus]PSB29869.1 hypothetical protein C7B82_09955 [Stenomitos frigidus ULC18]
MFYIAQRFPGLLGSVLLAGVSLTITASVTAQIPPAPPLLETPSAQANYADCQPPSPGEYLLLVMSKTSESQEQVRRTVPPNTTVTVCNYLNDVVTRVGGFTTADTANAWAKYMRESIGLSAFVARPSEVAAQTSPTPVQPFPKPSSPPITPRSLAQTSPTSRDARGYNPQILGGGYAVLVDYFSRPELATQVRQLVGKEIGLVSYRQRPYLLAVHTTDQSLANATLQALTDRGFWAMVVDSRRVTLLGQAIATSQPTVKK